MEDLIQLHVTLLEKGTNQPLNGDDYRVKFYDQDLIKDDFLGESVTDVRGHALVSITRSDFISNDSPMDKHPDVYFVVEKDGEEIYKSIVLQNLPVKEAGDFPVSGGYHCDLGTYVV